MTGAVVNKQSLEDFGGVLAAPPRSARRLAIAAAVLAVALAAAAIIIVVVQRPGPAARLAATLRPRGSQGASSAAFSPDGKTLAVIGSAHGSTCLWDLATRRQVATVTDPSNDTVGVDGGAFSPDGKTLAIADSNGSTYLWDVATRRLAATLTDPGGVQFESPFVAAVAFSPDGAMLAAGDLDDSTYLWDVATRRLAATVTDPDNGRYEDSGGIESVAFSTHGTLAVGDGDGNAYLWDVATRRVIATIFPPINVLEANSLFYNPNADVNGEVEGGGDPIGVSVAFSADGKVLAIGVDYGYGTDVWNSTGTQQTATVTDPGGDNTVAPQLALSPDGGMLAVVDHNGRTYLWRLG
jgi:WD40 repeat protein